jgi:hypothetical protein
MQEIIYDFRLENARNPNINSHASWTTSLSWPNRFTTWIKCYVSAFPVFLLFEMPRLILLSMNPLAHHMSCIILLHCSILYWLRTSHSCICVCFFPIDASFEMRSGVWLLPFEGLSQHVSKAKWRSLKPLLWTSTLAVQTGKMASSNLLPLLNDGYVLDFLLLNT